MYLRGEGVKADAAMAKMWFERGAEHSDRECHNGLGIIWRDGLVLGRKDLKKALMHFSIAAGQELAEAQVNLGKHHYCEPSFFFPYDVLTRATAARRELKLATTYFETAVRHGSPFEAYYYLAEIQGNQAVNPAMPANMVAGSCAMAVSFHKVVAERGVWDDDLLRDADVAWNSGTERGKEIAMLKWQIAAEQGYEIAQNNLAYVLDQGKSKTCHCFVHIFPDDRVVRIQIEAF
jgi:SEL1 protein